MLVKFFWGRKSIELTLNQLKTHQMEKSAIFFTSSYYLWQIFQKSRVYYSVKDTLMNIWFQIYVSLVRPELEYASCVSFLWRTHRYNWACAKKVRKVWGGRTCSSFSAKTQFPKYPSFLCFKKRPSEPDVLEKNYKQTLLFICFVPFRFWNLFIYFRL
jgi:hypothetical protein